MSQAKIIVVQVWSYTQTLNITHNVQYESTVCGPIAIWLGAVQCLLPAGNQSCEPRPQAQHPAGLWNQIFIVHKALAKYEESALPNKTHSSSSERDKMREKLGVCETQMKSGKKERPVVER